MKKSLLLLLPFLFFSCEADFDELRDTDQRYVTFNVDLSNMFSNLLVESNGDYFLKDTIDLDSRHRVRITAFCYDGQSLVKSYTLFSTPSDCPEVSFRHLMKDHEYQFLFLADVVRYNSDIDYYETWYQMKTMDFSEFYLTTFDLGDTATYNHVGRCLVSLVPENQNDTVDIAPATYNGFINFTQIDNIDKLDVYFNNYCKWSPQTMAGIEKLTKIHQLYNLQHNGSRLFPATLCMADNQAAMIVKRYSVSGTDSVTVKILNGSYRPFVVEFDCQRMKVSSTIYY